MARKGKFRQQYERLERELGSLRSKRDKVAREMQRRCKHGAAHLLQQDDTPPIRVCTKCGYAEHGWYCGYTHLRASGANVPHILSGISKHIIGAVINNGVHCKKDYRPGDWFGRKGN